MDIELVPIIIKLARLATQTDPNSATVLVINNDNWMKIIANPLNKHT